MLQKVRNIQKIARGTAENERAVESAMFQVKPSNLVVPSKDEPLSMFEAATWGMSFPDLFRQIQWEMACQLLFEQEHIVTYRGYNMFFLYAPFAMMRCRQEDMENVLQQKPHLKSAPLDVVEDPEGRGPVAVDEIAQVMDEEGEARTVHQVHVNFNQKNDYLHRGSSVLLQCMSLVMYSRFVRRVSRNKAGKVDGVKFFDFDEHYPHFHSSVQACLGIAPRKLRNGHPRHSDSSCACISYRYHFGSM